MDQIGNQRWVADQVERRPVETLIPYAANPRHHDPDQVAKIVRSMERWGVTMPILIDEQGEIIAGHGRVLAAKKLAYAELPVLVARGWSDDDKRAYRIADNRLAELSTWNDALLLAELGALKADEFDLNLIGFSPAELAKLEADRDDALGELENKSELLELVRVTMAEPSHQVALGDHYVLGDRHHLFCESVIAGWPKWSPFLTGDRLFCPYPGVFVPFSKKATDHSLIMVQPDPYIAGHMLDRFEEANKGALVKQ